MIRDKNQKLRLYERFGVPEYWITDQTERFLSVRKRKEAQEMLL